jgi:ADP-ribosylglycohydrolase
MRAEPLTRAQRLTGLLLGQAVGDALGLPREGLGPERARKFFGDAPLTHRLLLGRGMISDDTEHACMTAQALLSARGDVERFSRSLGWRLRGWLLTLPAGIGFATLRSLLKLWLGFSPASSGVRSAGNGPAMRAAIIGAFGASDDFVLAATRITHRDPLAEDGALLIALAARQVMLEAPLASSLVRLDALISAARTDAFRSALTSLRAPLTRGDTVPQVAAALGLERGVTGFILHTVPIALYAPLRHADSFRDAVEQSILCGGDTDTVAAIVGALSGAALGPQAIPTEWTSRLLEWPRSLAWLSALGQRLADGGPPLPLFWPGLVPRSLFQIAVVLLHGFRRLGPPY